MASSSTRGSGSVVKNRSCYSGVSSSHPWDGQIPCANTGTSRPWVGPSTEAVPSPMVVNWMVSVWPMAHVMQRNLDSIRCAGPNQSLICAGTNGSRSLLGALRLVENLSAMLKDLRYAFRQLLKNPGFTTVAVLTLALGIGANTATFSVVDGVLLKPLPYEEPGQLVQVWEAPGPGGRNSVSPGAFLDWREHSTVFENLSLRQHTDMNLTGEGEPERVGGLAMSAAGLQILRARPLLGRTFAPDEDQPGKDKVVVLTHRFWKRRLGGKTNIVGRAIRLSEQSYTVIGV